MEYRIVESESAVGLEIQVNKEIQNGFEPVGGVSVTRYVIENEKEYWLYSQAMIKTERQI